MTHNNRRYNIRNQALRDSGIDEYQLARKYIATAFGHTGDPFDFNGADAIREPIHLEQLKTVIDYLTPRHKATLPTCKFSFCPTDSPINQANAILTQVADGSIPVDIAQTALQMIRTKFEMQELQDLAARVQALENGRIAGIGGGLPTELRH